MTKREDDRKAPSDAQKERSERLRQEIDRVTGRGGAGKDVEPVSPREFTNRKIREGRKKTK